MNGREVVDVDARVQPALPVDDEVAQGEHLSLDLHQSLAVHGRVEVNSTADTAPTRRQQHLQQQHLPSTRLDTASTRQVLADGISHGVIHTSSLLTVK